MQFSQSSELIEFVEKNIGEMTKEDLNDALYVVYNN